MKPFLSLKFQISWASAFALYDISDELLEYITKS
jgi:hypothetical protein